MAAPKKKRLSILKGRWQKISYTRHQKAALYGAVNARAHSFWPTSFERLHALHVNAAATPTISSAKAQNRRSPSHSALQWVLLATQLGSYHAHQRTRLLGAVSAQAARGLQLAHAKSWINPLCTLLLPAVASAVIPRSAGTPPLTFIKPRSAFTAAQLRAAARTTQHTLRSFALLSFFVTDSRASSATTTRVYAAYKLWVAQLAHNTYSPLWNSTRYTPQRLVKITCSTRAAVTTSSQNIILKSAWFSLVRVDYPHPVGFVLEAPHKRRGNKSITPHSASLRTQQTRLTAVATAWELANTHCARVRAVAVSIMACLVALELKPDKAIMLFDDECSELPSAVDFYPNTSTRGGIKSFFRSRLQLWSTFAALSSQTVPYAQTLRYTSVFHNRLDVAGPWAFLRSANYRSVFSTRRTWLYWAEFYNGYPVIEANLNLYIDGVPSNLPCGNVLDSFLGCQAIKTPFPGLQPDYRWLSRLKYDIEAWRVRLSWGPTYAKPGGRVRRYLRTIPAVLAKIREIRTAGHTIYNMFYWFSSMRHLLRTVRYADWIVTEVLKVYKNPWTWWDEFVDYFAQQREREYCRAIFRRHQRNQPPRARDARIYRYWLLRLQNPIRWGRYTRRARRSSLWFKVELRARFSMREKLWRTRTSRWSRIYPFRSLYRSFRICLPFVYKYAFSVDRLWAAPYHSVAARLFRPLYPRLITTQATALFYRSVPAATWHATRSLKVTPQNWVLDRAEVFTASSLFSAFTSKSHFTRKTIRISRFKLKIQMPRTPYTAFARHLRLQRQAPCGQGWRAVCVHREFDKKRYLTNWAEHKCARVMPSFIAGKYVVSRQMWLHAMYFQATIPDVVVAKKEYSSQLQLLFLLTRFESRKSYLMRFLHCAWVDMWTEVDRLKSKTGEYLKSFIWSPVTKAASLSWRVYIKLLLSSRLTAITPDTHRPAMSYGFAPQGNYVALRFQAWHLFMLCSARVSGPTVTDLAAERPRYSAAYRAYDAHGTILHKLAHTLSPAYKGRTRTRVGTLRVSATSRRAAQSAPRWWISTCSPLVALSLPHRRKILKHPAHRNIVFLRHCTDNFLVKFPMWSSSPERWIILLENRLTRYLPSAPKYNRLRRRKILTRPLTARYSQPRELGTIFRGQRINPLSKLEEMAPSNLSMLPRFARFLRDIPSDANYSARATMLHRLNKRLYLIENALKVWALRNWWIQWRLIPLMRMPATARSAQLLLLNEAMTLALSNLSVQTTKPLPSRILTATNRHLNLLRARTLLGGGKYVHI